MGLFSRKPKPLDPSKFYAISCEKFHKMANLGLELTPRGLILVPELLPIGERIILALLQDPAIQRRCGNNPETYYYVITAHSFDAGAMKKSFFLFICCTLVPFLLCAGWYGTRSRKAGLCILPEMRR